MGNKRETELKKLGYNLARLWVRISLYSYFGKIRVSGLENVPANKPVLFLPNHQNALLDVLLIGIDCNRSPWFLTRSDVFKNNTLTAIFDFLQMIPIYRIRDGRDSLKNNQAVFNRCSDLLSKGEAVLMFPEANHNLRRRVRPLSKGFTRILFKTLQQQSDIDVQIVPVGLNYREAVAFPDQVAVYFGPPISAKKLYNIDDERGSIEKMKKTVSDQLKLLTTHIEDVSSYDETVLNLENSGIEFLNPNETNVKLKNLGAVDIKTATTRKFGLFSQLAKGLFTIINLPLVLVWRSFVKPKVPEPEFMGTFRFAFALFGYPTYYLFLFIVLSIFFSPLMGLASIFGLFLFNWVYVKFS